MVGIKIDTAINTRIDLAAEMISRNATIDPPPELQLDPVGPLTVVPFAPLVV